MYRKRVRRIRRRSRRRFRRAGRIFRTLAAAVPERKYFDFAVAASTGHGVFFPYGYPAGIAAPVTGITHHWRCLPLNWNYPIGTGAEDRIGRRIFLRYIQLNLDFFMTGTNSAPFLQNGCIIRYVIATAKLNANKASAESGLFRPLASSAAYASDIHSVRDPNHMSKFRILADRQMVLTAISTDSTASRNTVSGHGIISHFLPINKHVSFTSHVPTEHGAAVPDFSTFNDRVYFLMVSCSHVDNEAAPMCKLVANIRNVYTDA